MCVDVIHIELSARTPHRKEDSAKTDDKAGCGSTCCKHLATLV